MKNGNEVSKSTSKNLKRLSDYVPEGAPEKEKKTIKHILGKDIIAVGISEIYDQYGHTKGVVLTYDDDEGRNVLKVFKSRVVVKLLQVMDKVPLTVQVFKGKRYYDVK